MPQLEGPATRIYNYVLGGFGKKKKKEDWQQMLAQVPILKTNKQTKNHKYDTIFEKHTKIEKQLKRNTLTCLHLSLHPGIIDHFCLSSPISQILYDEHKLLL